MRIISKLQSELIDAVLAEKEVGGLTAAILEKDIHVTEVLHTLAGLDFPNVRLIFCGGTSLSKAHGLIERMSEDVDLKVVLIGEKMMARNVIKKHLGQFKKAVIAAMERLGYVPDAAGFITFNENRYFSTTWSYQSWYENDLSLRPHLSLEFTLRTPIFAPVSVSLGTLIHQLAEINAPEFIFSCVAIEETLAEKILSFLRRYAQHRSGHMKQNWDAALVRHIYDIYCIVGVDASALAKAKLHFKELVQFDADEFSQHSEFVQNPRKCLLEALTMCETDEQTKIEYQTKLVPLIYGVNRPNFAEAFKVFKQCSQTLINTL